MTKSMVLIKIVLRSLILVALAACQAPPPASVPAVNPTASLIPTQAPIAESPATTAACKDYSNTKGGPNGDPNSIFWRLHIAFSDAENLAGCVSFRRFGERATVWRHTVPCQFVKGSSDTGSLNLQLQAITVTAEVPALPTAPITYTQKPLTYTVLQPGNYISCEFNLNEYINMALSESVDLGVTMTTPVYTYTYFSMSALTYLTSSQPYSGNMLTLKPDCPAEESFSPACQPSIWRVKSDQPETIRFESSFNNEEIFFPPATLTPVSFTYTTTQIQGWWIGMRTQYDTSIETDTLKIEHLHDQSQRVPNNQAMFRHQTSTYGQRYLLSDPDYHFKMWGGSNHIFIGGLPDTSLETFNGGLIQIMIDPSGGSAPDGGM